MNLQCTESYDAHATTRPALKRSRDFDLYCSTHERLVRTENDLSYVRNLYFVKAVELERMQQQKEEAESEVKRLREQIASMSWVAEEMSDAKFTNAVREAAQWLPCGDYWCE